MSLRNMNFYRNWEYYFTWVNRTFAGTKIEFVRMYFHVYLYVKLLPNKIEDATN